MYVQKYSVQTEYALLNKQNFGLTIVIIFQLLGFLATVAHIIQINWIYKIFSQENDEDEFDGRGKLHLLL